MSQLNLFTGSIQCHYCGGGSAKPGSPHKWQGFHCQDTGRSVCADCRDIHYINKAREMGTLKEYKPNQAIPSNQKILERLFDCYIIESMTYSEMPIIINN
ncbi:MAG: hypothetical protein ABJG41_09925 [Cyclobacteriaceae bacterium]